MPRRVLVDSGPLVAVLNRRDSHHSWAKRELANLTDPLVTCEAVLSEAFFLLSRIRNGISTLIELLHEGLVFGDSNFSFAKEPGEILRHLEHYSAVPMSFADACLVRMCELEDSIVFTTDRGFLIYRRHHRQPIPLISPF